MSGYNRWRKNHAQRQEQNKPSIRSQHFKHPQIPRDESKNKVPCSDDCIISLVPLFAARSSVGKKRIIVVFFFVRSDQGLWHGDLFLRACNDISVEECVFYRWGFVGGHCKCRGSPASYPPHNIGIRTCYYMVLSCLVIYENPV